MDKKILLSHGGGGEESNQLIHELFYQYFSNEILLKSEDAAILTTKGNIAFTTDSFTVSPLFFAGGDIGKIAIAGTLNDLSMMGAKPLYVSCAFIIEEGMDYNDLEKIVKSMTEELSHNDAKIVCGDTKVVPKGSIDKIFITTSGIGEVVTPGISAQNIDEHDMIIVSRDIGRHGATILAERESIDITSNLSSDCKSLWPVVKHLLDHGIKPKAMRDATRGGLAAVLNEWAVSSNICIELDEEAIPISEEVQGLCEIFGFEATDFANEGTFILALRPEQVDKALKLLHAFQDDQSASLIGKVTTKKPKKVILNTPWGSSRYLDLPKGELLPRIC
ncbi:hydrogenase expression/formation protein HypE [Sulfurovum sp. zt1-1]|uniref:Hydrogenase expression/formation protein HypE n=1 Tax=Sulfurovum zhangzhouensis TaxID=3019067 RepID=A0ABT7QWC2_9BACT|nr:hydrogenase expression/formation protein HypE [Sulfurovum zhangzhouensis]MDM5271143.1 hydrogenase expression/formation protein HypE [Sulfurovum zhangzhouensis]